MMIRFQKNRQKQITKQYRLPH